MKNYLYVLLFCFGCINYPNTFQTIRTTAMDLYLDSLNNIVKNIDQPLSNAPKRQRYINPYSSAFDGGRYDCQYAKQPKPNKKILENLFFCGETSKPYSYHFAFTQACEQIQEEIVVFTLDTLQQDSSILYIATCEGDSYSGRGDSPGWGCLFVFQWETNHYTLKDIIFGRLVGFDIINGQLAPLVFGLCNAKATVSRNAFPSQDSLWQSFRYVETRLIWNGTHLQSDELVSVQYSQKDKNEAIIIEKVLNLEEMKKSNIYNYLYEHCIPNQSQMIRKVTLHYKFRSFSLANRDNPEYKEEPDVQNRWRKGFRID